MKHLQILDSAVRFPPNDFLICGYQRNAGAAPQSHLGGHLANLSREIWVGYCAMVLTRSWWHHLMETFSVLLDICAGNKPITGEFPAQRPVTRSFDVIFDPGLNKRLSKQSWGWWFETPSRSLWRHCDGKCNTLFCMLATVWTSGLLNNL